MVNTPDFRSQCPGLESCWRWNSAHDLGLHCTEPFIVILQSSQYDLNINMLINVERDVKCQTFMIIK